MSVKNLENLSIQDGSGKTVTGFFLEDNYDEKKAKRDEMLMIISVCATIAVNALGIYLILKRNVKVKV